jgi:glycosyltransferase involved in cell wall biosynthesis
VSPPKDLDKTDGELWFGMIGAVTPLKGQDLFIYAANKVVKVLPNARFFIVGTNFYRTETDHEYEEELRFKAQSDLLNGKVKFLGFRSDIPAVLSCLDVLVQPNRGPEGLGRSILEAMACGVPVISVDQWGPKEIIRNRETGLLFRTLDVSMLSQKMIEFGKNNKLRSSCAENALLWIRQNQLTDKIVEEFEKILENSLI